MSIPIVGGSIIRPSVEPELSMSNGLQHVSESQRVPVKKSTVPALFRSEMSSRYVLFPIRFQKIWEMYKKHEASFWTAEEIDLSEDAKGWEQLSDEERHFVKFILAFFAASDGIVGENLALRFIRDVQIPEARCFYGFQLAMENIHSEIYSLLIDTYIRAADEKTLLFRALENYPTIADKAKWALKWISSSQPFTVRLVAFAIVEGIFFSGAFCSIFWLKKRGKHLKGLFKSNEFISRDEGMHTDFAVLLYSMLPPEDRLSNELITQMIREAVEIEETFIASAIPVSLIGMNCDLMVQYVQYVTDRLVVALGYDKIFNVQNPFEWMINISVESKTDFFTQRVSEYALSGVRVGLNISGNPTTVMSDVDKYKPLDDF